MLWRAPTPRANKLSDLKGVSCDSDLAADWIWIVRVFGRPNEPERVEGDADFGAIEDEEAVDVF